MPNCFYCSQKPVFNSGHAMCRKHFILHFERKVKHTIRRFGLFERKSRLAVACSGGKDSTSLLYILKNLGYNVEALAVDEGIKGYRDTTLKDLQGFCKKHKIKLKVVSFKAQYGFTLDKLIKEKKLMPCTACGVLRRYLLNKASKGYDYLVTGHNLDDEAQSIMMNIMKSNVHLMARLGPRTGQVEDSMFTQRVKPLYLCSEKEVAAYAFLKDFGITFSECPYAHSSFRASVRDMLNNLEAEHPGTKAGIVNSFLKLMPFLKQMPVAKELDSCKCCGEPSGKDLCNACNIVKTV